MQTQAELKNKVEDHLRALEAGDFESATEDYADDYTTTVTRPTGEEEELERDELKEDWKDLYEGFPDLSVELHEMAAEDDWVIVRWELSGTHEGDLRFLDIAPTGKEVEYEGYNSYRFEDGDIVETNGVAAGVDFLRQLDVDLPFTTPE